MAKAQPVTSLKRVPASRATRPRISRLELPRSPLTLVINLKRRGDRLRRIRKVLRESGLRHWERVEAVDGRTLSWDGASATTHMSTTALSNARWAECHAVPTICTRTGSFSPHLTLAALGCALSHRKAWERLVASAHEWALILEDDVAAVADDLEAKLERTIATLPSPWQLCYVGFHESSGVLLRTGERLRLSELGPDEGQTGLFGYLLRRTAAVELLSSRGDMFPLSHQVDVMIGTRHWRPLARFALSPEAVLVHSPKSEEGECDTDVQSLGRPTELPHKRLKEKGMLVL